MKRNGNDQAGFSVDFDVPTRTVRVVAWGFWGPDVATAFGDAVVEAGGRPTAAHLAFDMTQLKPMRDEGQAAWRKVMAALPKLGTLTKVSVTTASQLTKLQLFRIAKDAAGKSLDKVEWIEPMLARQT
jgi:hypothetical protein